MCDIIGCFALLLAEDSSLGPQSEATKSGSQSWSDLSAQSAIRPAFYHNALREDRDLGLNETS